MPRGGRAIALFFRTGRAGAVALLSAAGAVALFLAAILLALPPLPAAHAEEMPRIMYVCTQTDPLNVRERPSIHAEITARLERGEAATVVRVKNGWALIDGVSEAGQGWASLKYLSEEPPEGAEEAPEGAEEAPKGAEEPPEGAEEAPKGAEEPPEGALSTLEEPPSEPQ